MISLFLQLPLDDCHQPEINLLTNHYTRQQVKKLHDMFFL